MTWPLAIARAAGWGTLAGMSFLAFLAMVLPEQPEYRKPEYVSWWFGGAAFLYALGRARLPVIPWARLGLRVAGLILMYAVLMDVAQVVSDALDWGPWWFTFGIFVAIALAALPERRPAGPGRSDGGSPPDGPGA